MTKLSWLLISLALAAAPHLERLPLWMGPLCLALGLWRVAIERRGGELPKRWLLLLLTATVTIGVFSRYHTLLGRDAGVALLVMMIALKLMEMRTRRDAMVAIFLGYFLVATNFLYSQSIPAALYLLLVVLVTTAAMIAHNDTSLDTRAKLRLSGVLLVQAVPLMLVLFVLFPRVGPLWGLPKDAFAGMTGLSDKMSPGTISQLISSDAIAFRVKFDGAPPERNLRYWRGPIFWDYDGTTWFTQRRPRGPARMTPQGPPLGYQVTLEADNQRWLFALDLPATVPPDSTVTSDFQILARTPVQRRMRYAITSYTHYRLGDRLDAATRERALRLPEGADPKARKLARNWQATAQSPIAVVQRALAMFRQESFYYTLSPPLLGQQPVDGFLFETRRGFCEHYAGAFVFLMRAAGVPARVVTGYQGGEINPLGDYMIVRQSDAHAWAEVWLDEQGWVRVDPTAAVSPLRIESGIAAALPAGEVPQALIHLDAEWIRRVRLSWDLLNNNWNQWVLGYGEDRQKRFLANFNETLASWQGMATALVIGVAALLLAISVWMLWLGQRGKTDPVVAAYEKFCAKLARRGMVRSPYEGPADFAARAAQLRPDLGQQISPITELYIALRYGHRHPAATQELRRAVRRFRC